MCVRACVCLCVGHVAKGLMLNAISPLQTMAKSYEFSIIQITLFSGICQRLENKLAPKSDQWNGESV